jgi:hypothetical protein
MSGRGWTRRLPWPVCILITVMLLGQLAGALDPRIRPAILAGSLVVLDVLGTVYSLTAARRGINRVSWLLYAAARAAGVINTAALGIAFVDGSTA